MWPLTILLTTSLLVLSGSARTQANSIISNENAVSKFLCGANFQNCYGEQLSTTIYEKNDKIYRMEVYNLKLPTALSEIVREQENSKTAMQHLDEKILEENVERHRALQAVEVKLQEQNTEISTRIKEEAELLKSNFELDMRKHATLLKPLKTKLAWLDKKISERIEVDPNAGYPSSCADAFEKDVNAESGIYTLHLPGSAYADPFKVYCLADPEGGPAWTVVERRTDSHYNLNWDLYWDDYKTGFGDLEDEFFVGLKKLHALTNDQPNELWIQMEDFEDEKRFAKYSEFSIGDESENYALNEVDGFTGDAGDSMARHKGQQFSTKDRDNDNDPSQNCADAYSFAWWYDDCSYENTMVLNFNGGYSYYQGSIHSYWYWNGYLHSIKLLRVAIRPKVYLN